MLSALVEGKVALVHDGKNGAINGTLPEVGHMKAGVAVRGNGVGSMWVLVVMMYACVWYGVGKRGAQ